LRILFFNFSFDLSFLNEKIFCKKFDPKYMKLIYCTHHSIICHMKLEYSLYSHLKKRTLLLLCILQISDPLIWIEIRVQLSVRENLQLYSIDEMLTNSLCILIIIVVFSIVFIHIMTTISGTISLKNVYL
jgi:hypothetical protein